eukprot:jgi/Mesvir1/15962/Mv08277-RA.1
MIMNRARSSGCLQDIYHFASQKARGDLFQVADDLGSRYGSCGKQWPQALPMAQFNNGAASFTSVDDRLINVGLPSHAKTLTIGRHRRASSDSFNDVFEAIDPVQNLHMSDAPGLVAAELEELNDEQLLSMFMDVDSMDALVPDAMAFSAGGMHDKGASQAKVKQESQENDSGLGRSVAKDDNGNEEFLDHQSTSSGEGYGDEDSGDELCSSSFPAQGRAFGGNRKVVATDATGKVVLHANNKNDPSALDPKRAKRILANRQSAQRSRMRKLQYISELEKRVSMLQGEIGALTPQITFLAKKRSGVDAENAELRRRIDALAQETRAKDAANDTLRQELTGLSTGKPAPTLESVSAAVRLEPLPDALPLPSLGKGDTLDAASASMAVPLAFPLPAEPSGGAEHLQGQGAGQPARGVRQQQQQLLGVGTPTTGEDGGVGWGTFAAYADPFVGSFIVPFVRTKPAWYTHRWHVLPSYGQATGGRDIAAVACPSLREPERMTRHAATHVAV